MHHGITILTVRFKTFKLLNCDLSENISPFCADLNTKMTAKMSILK